MRDIDLSLYEPHWGMGHPTPDKASCPWCNPSTAQPTENEEEPDHDPDHLTGDAK